MAVAVVVGHRSGCDPLELLDSLVEAGGVSVVDGGLALHVAQLRLGACPQQLAHTVGVAARLVRGRGYGFRVGVRVRG